MRYIYYILILSFGFSSCLKSNSNDKYSNYLKCEIDGKKWHSKSALLFNAYTIDFHAVQDTIMQITLEAKKFNSNHKISFGHDAISFEFPINKLIDDFSTSAPFTLTSNVVARYFNGAMSDVDIEKYNLPTPYQVINYTSTQSELTISSITRLEDCHPDIKNNKYLYVENLDGQCFVIKGTFAFIGINSFNETKVITNGKFRLKDYIY